MISQCSTPLVDIRFCGHLPTSPKTKNLKFYNSLLLKKMVFLTSQIWQYHLSVVGKPLFSTSNVMILQRVKSEDLRFGEHVDIQVNPFSAHKTIFGLVLKENASIVKSVRNLDAKCEV